MFPPALLRLALRSAGVLLLVRVGGARGQTLTIWPDEDRGTGVTYGADVKLTMWRVVDEGAVSAVNGRFSDDLRMDLVRLPMVAIWGTGDGKHLDVRDYAIDAKGKGMDVFLSVANTRGDFKSNGDLDDGHNADKFASWMFCNECSSPGLYNVNLTHYKNWITTLVDTKIGSSNVDYVGPWNEDPATSYDYSQLDIGEVMVGVETWGLGDADTRYSSVQGAIGIAGSHNYVSDGATPNLKEAYGQWEDFAAAGSRPEWFTETTLYDKGTAEGIAHMLPAISAGIKKMIIYQAVPRLINPDGSDGQHYSATKRLIDYSLGKGAALRVETNDQNGIIAAFKDGTDLHVHLCNLHSSQNTMYINLQSGFTVNGVGSIQPYGGSVTATVSNGGTQLQVGIPSKTYVHITANGLGVSGPTPAPPTTTTPAPPTASPPSSPGYNFITHKAGARRVRADPNTGAVDTVSGSSSGTWVQWKEEPKNNDYFFLVHKESGLRLYSGDATALELGSGSNQKHQWKWVAVGGGWFRLENRKWGKWLHVNPDGSSFQLGPQDWTGDNTQWKLQAAP